MCPDEGNQNSAEEDLELDAQHRGNNKNEGGYWKDCIDLST